MGHGAPSPWTHLCNLKGRGSSIEDMKFMDEGNAFLYFLEIIGVFLENGLRSYNLRTMGGGGTNHQAPKEQNYENLYPLHGFLPLSSEAEDGQNLDSGRFPSASSQLFISW